jgi:RNA polymerase subunit RPABC4/transcription elongation factor Spt4
MEWQVCPSCHTRLKKGCMNCGRLLDLSWGICPYCSASQVAQETNDWVNMRHQHVQRSLPEARPLYTSPPPAAEALEYIEGDEY